MRNRFKLMVAVLFVFMLLTGCGAKSQETDVTIRDRAWGLYPSSLYAKTAIEAESEDE